MTIKRAIFISLIALTLVAFPLQCLIEGSAENIAAVCLVMTSAIGVLLYVGVSDGLNTQPLSTIAILGYCVTTHLGALIVQTASWTPLISYLYSPLYTFAVIVFYQWIAILVHTAYRYFSSPKRSDTGFFRSLSGWIGLYRIPSAGALWFMGSVGLASFFLSRFEGVAGKIGQAFNFLTWAPFLIPFFLREIGDSYCNARRSKFMLVAFTGAIGVLGLAVNARQIMFIGVLTIGVLYLFAGMRSKELVTRKMLQKVGMVAILLAIVAVPLSNLATAMAIARGWRGKISPVAMIQTTYHIWRRPALLAAYRAETAAHSRYLPYDERYVANPGLARLVSTKFIDNSLHFAGTLKSDAAKARLLEVSGQFAWAVLPEPVLNRLHIKLDKEGLTYSMGDYLAYMSRGIPLGGHKTGSMFAQGQALLGPFFPILYAALCLLLFGVMDLLIIRHRDAPATICTLGMLEIWWYFNQGIHYEALHSVFAFFARNLEQMILIYAIVFAMARVVQQNTNALLSVRKMPQWQQST
jgi:hypothetical protein